MLSAASSEDKIQVLDFIGKSAVIVDLLKVVDRIAATNASVLIYGESGVGKNLLARRIHSLSAGAKNPFLCVDCTALSHRFSDEGFLSYMKGLSSEAVKGSKEYYESIHGGTIFFDEIGELSLDFQAKLLHFIQFGKFEELDSDTTMTAAVRIIAATNRNLEDMVKKGTFRSDLFFRLHVLPLHVPPLRNRLEDIELLADFFLKKYSVQTHKVFHNFSTDAIRALTLHDWPGNVRELQNVTERACVFGTPPTVYEKDLRLNNHVGNMIPAELFSHDLADKTLKTALNTFKKHYVTHVLKEHNWNQTETAKALDVQRTYVSRLMNELDIRKNYM
ncbi:MAG: sigma 54-interacting transcriptional regulator [Spirochaetales bacterium]